MVGLADGSWAVYDFITRTQLYSGKEGEEAVSTIRFSATGNFLVIATKVSSQKRMNLFLFINTIHLNGAQRMHF